MTAALLACLLILPASAGLSSCGTDTSQETQSASTADSATDAQESVAAADRCDLPEDLSFDNAEISFLYADTQGKNDELVSDGNSGLISEAVFERNELVRNQLRVKLSFLPSEEDSVATKLENDVASGLGSYDIVVNGTYRAVSPAPERSLSEPVRRGLHRHLQKLLDAGLQRPCHLHPPAEAVSGKRRRRHLHVPVRFF